MICLYCGVLNQLEGVLSRCEIESDRSSSRCYLKVKGWVILARKIDGKDEKQARFLNTKAHATTTND